MHYELWIIAAGAAAGLACGFLNTVASSGSAVSLPILMMLGLDPVSANATNRLPVLIGALSATNSFNRRKAIDWSLTAKVSMPVALGGLAGALLAEAIPARDLGLVITAAVLIALVLLFSKVKKLVAEADAGPVKYGPREIVAFALIGAWLGFIVLDGATYMLLALTLMVGLPLGSANAIKTVALVPATIVAMVVFADKGSIDWTLGAIFGAGSIVGGILGARLWLVPYGKANLPGTLLHPDLGVAVLSALLLCMYGLASFRRSTSLIALSVGASVAARVVVGVAQDPTSHNLWPLEMVIALMVGFACAAAGAIVGWLIARWFPHIADDARSAAE